VIDAATNAVTDTIDLAGATGGLLALSPDGGVIYVSNAYNNTVSVIDAATKAVTGSIAVGLLPQGLAVTPDGHTLFVVSTGSDTVWAVAV
jgi:YVTN family beta-propeller protein